MPVERPRKMWGFSGEIWLGKLLKRQNVQALTENVERKKRHSESDKSERG